MRIKGVTLDEFTAIVKQVSERDYEGHLAVSRDAHDLTDRTRTCQAQITATVNDGKGVRRTRSCRRAKIACWHAVRDVLSILFQRYPDAKVTTMLATYEGREGFWRDYPATGLENLGSVFYEVVMPDLCTCDGNTPLTHAQYQREWEAAFAVWYASETIARPARPLRRQRTATVTVPEQSRDIATFDPAYPSGTYYPPFALKKE